jgi:hypothetical protein
MVVNDKENINVRLHWFRGGLTGSGVMISVQGNSSLLFRKYADRIKIIRISGDNPFY